MSIRSEREQHCTHIVIDRPPVNALDLASVLEFEAVLREAPPDRSVILTGTGNSFSAGVDTRTFAAASRRDREAQVLAITRVTAALLALQMPLVAAVNGHAMGGGFVLMLCADYRVVVDDDTARFGLTEALAGIPFPAGPTEIIRSELPAPLLRRLTLSSVVIDVRELLAAGVVDELCPRGGLREIASERARQMAGQSAFSVVKTQIRGGLRDRLATIARSGRDPHLGDFAD